MGFKPKEDEPHILIKKYEMWDDYCIEINSGFINYGNLITNKGTSRSTRFNITMLECVNRLLEKGYPPYSISVHYYNEFLHANDYFIYVMGKNDTKFLKIQCTLFYKKLLFPGEYEVRMLYKLGGIVDGKIVYFNEISNSKQRKSYPEILSEVFHIDGIFEE